MSKELIPWEEAQRISDITEVDDAIRDVLDDQTEDNICSLIQLVIYHYQPAQSQQGEAVAWQYGTDGGITRAEATPEEWKTDGEHRPLFTSPQPK